MEIYKLEKLRLDYEVGFKEAVFAQLISPGKELPIAGSWGYSEDRPIIIEKNHSSLKTELPFDYVGFEHWIAKKRIEQEMIIYRQRGSEPIKPQCYLKESKLIKKKNKVFDHLVFAFFAIHKNFDIIYRYNPEYWFDITSLHRNLSFYNTTNT
ncbi:hypothetical protein CAP36_00625 [Chitinophagaceae bacterium IBVUCB2]|nr:hypothetical protein CAP36_00625 [Chitinophagaceae bacterium IBVUCB2]